MDNLNELGIKFGEGTTWIQKNKCGWCEKTPIYYTRTQYLLKGNICLKCITMINDIHFEHINEERIRRMKEKEDLLETLGKSLKKPMEEDERQKIVDIMQKLHEEVRHTKIDLDYDM